jgi:hypothetical protein
MHEWRIAHYLARPLSRQPVEGQAVLENNGFIDGHTMRISYALCFLVAAFSVPAAADDLKQEVEKIAAAYAENFNKQDAARIAALYATGGVHVNPMGPRTDIEELYKGVFKAGFDHQETTVDQASETRQLGTYP